MFKDVGHAVAEQRAIFAFQIIQWPLPAVRSEAAHAENCCLLSNNSSDCKLQIKYKLSPHWFNHIKQHSFPTNLGNKMTVIYQCLAKEVKDLSRSVRQNERPKHSVNINVGEETGTSSIQCWVYVKSSLKKVHMLRQRGLHCVQTWERLQRCVVSPCAQEVDYWGEELFLGCLFFFLPSQNSC